MLSKLIVAAFTSLASLGLFLTIQEPPKGERPPDPKKKKHDEKKKKGAEDDLRHAYDLLRRLKVDGGGPAEDRLKDWMARSSALYRKGVDAYSRGDKRLAHEYGASAHDLARAVDHALKADHAAEASPDLPPPPEPAKKKAEDHGEHVNHDLQRAFDRYQEIKPKVEGVKDAAFYLDAAKDLYNAARHDAEEGRLDRAGELAKAAEAMTHVPEHLAHAAEAGSELENRPEPPKRPEPPSRSRREVRVNCRLPSRIEWEANSLFSDKSTTRSRDPTPPGRFSVEVDGKP